MIKHWLHEKPSNVISEYKEQLAQAVFVEERYFETWGRMLSNMLKKR